MHIALNGLWKKQSLEDVGLANLGELIMAKANLILPDGTKVVIEGSTEEVQRLLKIYAGKETGPADAGSIKAGGNEIPGIACISDSGEFKLTVRDIKAKNAKDAAIRLVHIIVYAYEKLKKEAVSSRKVVTPILKQWRLHTGSIRGTIANLPGIIRDRDNLSLDVHAKRDAEKYIKDVSDDTVQGKWKPSYKGRKKVKKKKTVSKKKRATSKKKKTKRSAG